jgi:hypothetical protein
MLLYLTNIGDILAKSFRYVYGSLCSCKSDPTQRDKKHKVQNRGVKFGLQRSVSSVSSALHQRTPLHTTLSLPNSPMSTLNRQTQGIHNQTGYLFLWL